jgi:hypothetical protein
MGTRLDGALGRLLIAGLLASGALAAGAAGTAAAAGCVATGAVDRDGTSLTARVVNPAGVVRGAIDAGGCSVGVYFGGGSSGLVRGAEIFGARYYGVLVDGNAGQVAHADVRDSAIHDIGDVPITSSRHGQGVAYRAFGSGSATGTVASNRIWRFQEAGINMTGPGSVVTATDNTIRGRGVIETL